MANHYQSQHMVFVFMLFLKLSQQMQIGHFPLLMPNVHPYRDELYLCTPVKVSVWVGGGIFRNTCCLSFAILGNFYCDVILTNKLITNSSFI